MSYVFGIDLGTTYSCISYLDEYGKPVVLKNSDGDHTTPSVVFFESPSNVVVGIEAKRSYEVEQEKTIQFIKRKMGKENDSVMVDGTIYTAPEVSAYILKKIVADANAELHQTGVLQDGEEIKDVVITCPAYFGMNEREATKRAGELAGLNVLNIINEPTAAAISYGVANSGKSETVLVYDLGGGTFDITVMNIDSNNISVVCTGGDDQLGGKDWDECLMSYIFEKYEEEFGEDLSEDMEAVANLYIEVENWKKALTAREKVTLKASGDAGRFREEMTREQYEVLTKDLLDRTKNLLDDVLQTAAGQGYPLERIDRVLLVGGSSRMPQVAAMLERDYHVKPVLADPDEAVAKGAAIYANNEKTYNDFVQSEAQKAGVSVEQMKEDNLITGELDKKYAMAVNSGAAGGVRLNITNVLSRTYGMKVVSSWDERSYEIENMLMINDKLPASTTKSFATVANGQHSIMIEIFESRSTEQTMALEDRTPITEIEMKFTRQVPKGTELVITFSLDNAGILHILGEEMCNHSKLDTTFRLSNQMSDDEMKSAVARMASANVE